MNRNNQQGFTLIELIMVIVILGILAATALPKFADMRIDARIATLKGVNSAIQSAMTIAYSHALVQNQTGATGSITLEGTTINLAYGYPDATATGIGAAVRLSNDIVFTASSRTFTFASGVITSTNCRITYTAATGPTTPATSTIDVSNCS